MNLDTSGHMQNDASSSNGLAKRPDVGYTGRRNKRPSADYTLGEAIDLITQKEWNLLTDLYLCRCLPQSAVIEKHFLDKPEFHYPGYKDSSGEEKKHLEQKNKARATNKTRRTFTKLKDRGIVELTSFIADSAELPVHLRKQLRGETWYYLTGRGLRIVEGKRGILEENRLSKHELDMERVKKDHFWELAKVYLDLKYNWINQFPEYRQFFEWDWHPSLSIYSDDEVNMVRPDATLRVDEQLFYIELDRSTEPIQRSPFHSDQVSIENKLQRYRDVFKLSSNPIIKGGIIAFIMPLTVYKTRHENILAAAERVWGMNAPVLTGKNIKDILVSFSDRFQS